MLMAQWLQLQVDTHGLEKVKEAYDATDTELFYALNGSVEQTNLLCFPESQRAITAKARLKALAAHHGVKTSGRPSGVLTEAEGHQLLTLVFTEGAFAFMQRSGITAESLGKALMGRAVAMGTLAIIRGLL